jgi:hypothetical protein
MIIEQVFEIVSISYDLPAKLPEGFVFAQESIGQVRMPLGEFPVVAELTNDNAMTPNYTLSQLQLAKLVPRISLDEEVAQSTGEFQGEWIATLSSNQTTQKSNSDR